MQPTVTGHVVLYAGRPSAQQRPGVVTAGREADAAHQPEPSGQRAVGDPGCARHAAAADAQGGCTALQLQVSSQPSILSCPQQFFVVCGDMPPDGSMQLLYSGLMCISMLLTVSCYVGCRSSGCSAARCGSCRRTWARSAARCSPSTTPSATRRAYVCRAAEL